MGERGPLGLYCHSKNKEYKKSEEDLIQLESFSAMRELAATYAHEIKNPLFSIRGFIQLLQKSFGEDDKRREYTDIAIKELDRIQRIIMEFLALSRDISSEKNNDEAHNTVQQVIKDAFKLFQNAFKIKNINCQCNLSEEILQVPISDDHFKQICINLIQNSIDSMELGKSIYIDVKSDDNKVYISLQDEGKGIPEENLEKIFSPFLEYKEKGTGLGLYITKQIIEGCGGTIKVDSIYGEGTTFLLELPRERN